MVNNMVIISIGASINGAHDNQVIDKANPSIFPIPKGWAVVPDKLETPNFPFGRITTENINGISTVTQWLPMDVLKDDAEKAQTAADMVKEAIDKT